MTSRLTRLSCRRTLPGKAFLTILAATLVVTGRAASDGPPADGLPPALALAPRTLDAEPGFSFSAPDDYEVAGDPYALAVADFDGKHGADVATTTESGTVAVFLNHGDGTLSFSRQVAVPSWALGLVAADLDGVNGPDLATADFRNNSVTILKNDGTGGFGTVETYPLAPVPSLVDGIVAADFDGVDGLDLAVNHSSFDLEASNGVSILFNRGDGTFGDPVFYPVGLLGAHGIVAGDLDGNLSPDLVVTHRDAGSVWIYLNRGDGSLRLSSKLPSSLAPIDQVLVDLDGTDGLDLVITKFFDSIEIRFNRGDGSFGPGRSYAIDRGQAPAVADFDLDTDPDLIVPSFVSDAATQMANDGAGRLGPAEPLPIGYRTGQAMAADMDGLSGPDLIVADEDPDVSRFSVLLNQVRGIEVPIDVQPWRDPNVIDPGSPILLGVAVFSGTYLDALQVDLTSLRLNPADARARSYRVYDVDRDRVPDLVAYFRARDLAIGCGETAVELTGGTYGGIEFHGTDRVTNRACR